MLVEAGFRRTTPKPVHLEATKAPTRDIYAHFGFEASLRCRSFSSLPDVISIGR